MLQLNKGALVWDMDAVRCEFALQLVSSVANRIKPCKSYYSV